MNHRWIKPVLIVLAAAVFGGVSTYVGLRLFSGGNGRSARNVHIEANPEFAQKVQPFLEKHCLRCHGPELEKGGLRIDQLSASLDELDSVEHFQNMLDEINEGSMPPEDEPSPSADELAGVIPLLTEHVQLATELHSSGGGKPVRRLTRVEYANTVYDLLGVHLDTGNLNKDGAVGAFDTEAQALYTTDMYLENYMAAARDAVRRFVASRGKKPGTEKVRTQRPPKKGVKHVLSSAGMPAAGHLMVRIICWSEAPDGKRVFAGPAGKTKHEIKGTRAQPIHIERTLHLQTQETWRVVPGMGLGPTHYYQVTSPQPYQFFKDFMKGGDTPPDSAAKEIISRFAALMNRGREVDGDLLDGLSDFFLAERKRGKPFWTAVVEPLAMTMCTVEAMFHFEEKRDDAGPVSAVELANRLSYFLWRSAPDSELVALAQNGKLNEPDTRSRQIDRMMNDKKFDRFVRDFTDQWLELERQDLIAVDDALFRDFDDSTKESIKEETIQFMLHVIGKDLPLGNLIDSDFVLVNNAMAKHYGLPAVQGNEFQVVSLPADSRRGGLLTQAGILMQTGTGERTSVVERGAFIARKILSSPPPPPPPLVNDLPNSGADIRKMSAGELVRKHAAEPQCASCHNTIDPLGLGLEEFDAIGRYRKVDLRLNPDFHKQSKRLKRRRKNLSFKVPLETKGRTTEGQTFQGAQELKKVLLQKRDRVAHAYINALLTFANGRKAGITEKAVVEDILQRSAKADYPARSILKAVVESDSFTTN